MNIFQLNLVFKNSGKSPKVSIFFILFIVMVFTSLTTKAENIGLINLGVKIKIESKILEEERIIVVHTPENYDKTKDNYPVVYLLDGEFSLLYTAGIVDYLQKNQFMPKVIIVSINNVSRVKDFTPSPSKIINGMPQMGGADNFLSFIADELKPAIEQRYRVAPYSILLGHSFGGLLSIYSQQARPSLFNAHIAISPSLFYDASALIKSGEEFFKSDKIAPQFLYITLADENQKSVDSITAYVKILEQFAPETMQWTFEELLQEDHFTVVHPATVNGLKLLFKDWYIKDISTILKDGDITHLKRYYRKLSGKFGYDIDTPREMITAAGYYFLSNKRVNEAITTFKLNTLRYPLSGSAYINLAQAYQASKQDKLAKTLTFKACRLGKQYEQLGTGMFCDRAKALGMTE